MTSLPFGSKDRPQTTALEWETAREERSKSRDERVFAQVPTKASPYVESAIRPEIFCHLFMHWYGCCFSAVNSYCCYGTCPFRMV